ncbi:hypothetical protein U8527_05480 [Kordia algicida OT-1]|uniref:Uncharacterized protein n=1 Tax=Kordia algicida OT-1 TaxID=391587 RepID=A9DMS6_9FLAO|nr:hypothetical protein [Kordia algicida]EDP97776.1 hypothetical protein KAOT1_21477 [Kordia algicida OT-1]
MCKFENNFLLCSCSDDLEKSDIDWILKRHSKKQPVQSHKIIGQINIPEEFKHFTNEDYERIYEEGLKLAALHKVRKAELKNTFINIQFELNDRNCFDKDFTFHENDVLSIRLDAEAKVWADFVYKNSFWKIFEIKRFEYDSVNKGKIKCI